MVEPKAEEDFDESRELCADGNCLGVVIDGKCNVCGLPAGLNPPPGSPDAAMIAEGGHVSEATVGEATGGETFDDDDRKLCPDGACTGLVGADGKCKECGRSAAS
ncbi:MAG TPA: hypothetical protein VGL86_21515 [Polyangia bacterium]|jgi:hypothetical protein